MERLRLGRVSCWRLNSSERKQGEMSLRLLKDGLYKANRLFLELRLEARARLPYGQYWTLMESRVEISKQIRSKEQSRHHKKEVHLEAECGRHSLCRWMRKFGSGIEKDRVPAGENDNGDRDIYRGIMLNI